MVFLLLTTSAEGLTVGAPRVGSTRSMAPRMSDATRDAAASWYYAETHPKCADAFQPNPNMGGDNDYARRATLSSGGVTEETNAATAGWYYGDTHPKSSDAFQPNPNMGGDNDYARRATLSSGGVTEETNAATAGWYYADT